jgi:hypothetical protein
MTWAPLLFRLNRWEVLASVAGTALLVAAMLWFTWQLRTLAAAEPACLDPTTYVEACEQSPQAFYELVSRAEWLSYLGWVAPFGMGLVLGVPLVSREIEHVPGRLYPQIVLRESAVVAGTAVLLGLASVTVVARRRPG